MLDPEKRGCIIVTRTVNRPVVQRGLQERESLSVWLAVLVCCLFSLPFRGPTVQGISSGLGLEMELFNAPFETL